MSSLKRGRPKKNLNLSSASIEPGEFELPRFSSVLNQIGGDAQNGHLKRSGSFSIKHIITRRKPGPSKLEQAMISTDYM